MKTLCLLACIGIIALQARAPARGDCHITSSSCSCTGCSAGEMTACCGGRGRRAEWEDHLETHHDEQTTLSVPGGRVVATIMATTGDCYIVPPCSCIRCSASQITACCGAASTKAEINTAAVLDVRAQADAIVVQGDCYRGPPCSCVSCSASETTACCGSALIQEDSIIAMEKLLLDELDEMRNRGMLDTLKAKIIIEEVVHLNTTRAHSH